MSSLHITKKIANLRTQWVTLSLGNTKD